MGSGINCYIIARDRLIGLEKLLARIADWGVTPVILDNQSTYRLLLDFYETCGVEVRKMEKNFAQQAPWASKAVNDGNEYFIVTDPDIVPIEDCPNDAVEHLIRGLEQHNVKKAGLGLYLQDVPESFPMQKRVLEWEGQFWEKPFGDGFYDAPVDTTFAVYKRDTPYSSDIGIRSGLPYVARHLPWYAQDIDEETQYYLAHAEKGIPHWYGDGSYTNA